MNYMHNGPGWDRDKLIFSAERWGQLNCGEIYNRYPIRLKIPKMGVITMEPPYHALVWE